MDEEGLAYNLGEVTLKITRKSGGLVGNWTCKKPGGRGTCRQPGQLVAFRQSGGRELVENLESGNL
jgi:hypothetical protein